MLWVNINKAYGGGMSVLKVVRVLGVCVASFVTTNVCGSYGRSLDFGFLGPSDPMRSSMFCHVPPEPVVLPSSSVEVDPLPSVRSIASRSQSPFFLENSDVVHEGGECFFKYPSPSFLLRSLESEADKISSKKAPSNKNLGITKTSPLLLTTGKMNPDAPCFTPFSEGPERPLYSGSKREVSSLKNRAIEKKARFY